MLTPTLNLYKLAQRYKANFTELGKLLRLKLAPLPVQVDGVPLWFEDEVEKARGEVESALARLRKVRR